ncbi:hypothetical protein Tco_0547385, partial [Tanacetum coccineum]
TLEPLGFSTMKAYTVLSLTLAVQTYGLAALTLWLAALTCGQAVFASLVLLELGAVMKAKF